MIEWLALITIGAILNYEKKDEKNATSGSAPRLNSLEMGSSWSQRKEEYRAWRKLWEPQIDTSRWIPESTASRVVEQFPLPAQPGEIPPGYWKRKRLADLKKEFAAHNVAFLIQQKERQRAFFETVEKNPLTDEQMDGCICMDDALLIIAAAGSGKTSTMVAKAGYVLKAGLAKPNQILMLAFNRDAANELKARVSDRLQDLPGHEKITARTFSAFGLAVIGQATGIKPSLAPWVADGRESAKVREIVDTLRERDSEFRHAWDFFRAIYGRTFESAGSDKCSPVQARYLTADGKPVKSQQELRICNFLFYHGVNYRYEQAYHHDVADANHSQYRPDFYYPDIELYHEHFALDEDGNPPAEFEGYADGVEWKRKLHQAKGTALFETTSGDFRSGQALAKLKTELEQRGVKLEWDLNRPTKGPAPISTEQLASIIRVFQQHVKANGLTMHQLRSTGRTKVWKSDRTTRFLDLFERISGEWERQLRQIGCIDYDDMLLEAIEHIESGQYESPFTVILADEFQDSSRARVRLLKALHAKAPDQAHVCVVGDDWQGINRFAGADISAMTNFEQTFDHATRLMLATTFRSPQSVCDASSAFVQANPRQIAKKVETTNAYSKQGILVYVADNQTDASNMLEQQLEQMFKYARNGKLASAGTGKTITVMLLGRYRHEAPKQLRQWQHRFASQIEITFRTVHGSKGLEADFVMMLNVVEDYLGFPSQVSDDPILQLAMPEPDPFPHAEERRLFYVALTRARRQVRIFTTISAPSRFILELLNHGHVELECHGEPLSPCPQCDKGLLKPQKRRNGRFEACSTAPLCTFRRNIQHEHAAVSIGSTDAKMQSTKLSRPMAPGDTCPRCKDGLMTARRGNRGPFLGCSNFPTCRTVASVH